MKRVLVIIIALALMAVFFAGCGDNGATEPEDEVADEEVVVEEPSEDDGVVVEEPADDEDTYTLAELAEFDGMDGRPAYVAVDGVVYDITDSALWPEGDHSPCGLDAMAGRDLSEVIGESPHGRDIFTENGIPVVGTLEE